MATFPTSPAPHVVAPKAAAGGVGRVMRLVLYALAPTIVAHVMFFGPGLLVQITLGTATALLAEALALRLRHKPLRPFLSDGSAVITAVLLALCLPPLSLWWLIVSGTAFAILLAKHAYGGLGANPFNPAMVGYAALLVSFPVPLLHWLPPQLGAGDPLGLSLSEILGTILTGAAPARLGWDAMTSPTPLEALRTGLTMGLTMEEARSAAGVGPFGAPGWMWINLATVAGGLWLLAARIIRWHIPVAMLGTLCVCASLMYAADPGSYAGPLFHLSSGASLLGAFFIATDPISAATSNRGRLLYGAGNGLLTYFIRTWGGNPDGDSFAVLLMNLCVPLIDRYTIPRIYGHPR
jgi:electron transport complex protein RnfD